MSTLPTWVHALHEQGGASSAAVAPWLQALRQRAYERFADEGWPTTRQENWRHTSLAPLTEHAFAESPASGDGATATAAQSLVKQVRRDEPGSWVVFVDGRYAPELSDVGGLPDGVDVASMAEVMARHPDWVEPYFGSEADGEATAALNLAMANDGAFVRLAPGVALTEPVHLVFVALSPKVASFPRNLIIAGARSAATVIEHYVGADDGVTLTNAVTRVEVDASANLTHGKLQQEREQAFHLGALMVRQARDSTFASHSLSFGARLARHDIGVHFQGTGCSALLNGLYHANGQRHVDHHTRIDHAQPHGASREYYRGILDDAARGVFTGRVLVAEGADGTDAVQRSDSLLLSRRARADARPELEIYADDVKCAHGATVGQIEETSLFYLRSRGLDAITARNLLIFAFAATVLERIEAPGLRERALQATRAVLPAGDIPEMLV